MTAVQQQIGDQGEATRRLVVDLNSEAHQKQQYDTVMKSLAFKTMHQRREDTRDAFQGTYEWIFKPRHETRNLWSDFVQWLQQGEDIYWINGKAGSGKSTLMNFIWNHESYVENLKPWAGTNKLVIPSFFFHYGSEEQSSVLGLLRALLFQILDACPNLVGLVIPFIPTQAAVPWPQKALTKALMSVIKQERHAIKFCILIDGLDEFQGNVDEQESLMNVVRTLSNCDSAKLCVSSRPEAHLIYNFNNYKKLRLQDLTLDDMELYTKQEFKKYPLMARYADEEPSLYKGLVQSLPRKADGIFLWLNLAMQDLKAGIMKLDSLEELQKRVKKMDASLDGLFDQLLSAVDSDHIPELAMHLRLVLHRNEINLTNLAFGAHEELRHSLQNLCVPPLSRVNKSIISQLSRQLRDLEVRILTRSAGLLDIYKSECSADDISSCSCIVASGKLSRFSSVTRLLFHYNQARVRPIHRSVKEFVERSPRAQDAMRDGLVTNTQLNVIHMWVSYYHAASLSRISLDYFLETSCFSSPVQNLDDIMEDFHTELVHIFETLATMKKSGQLGIEHEEIADKVRSFLTEVVPALVDATKSSEPVDTYLDEIFWHEDMESKYIFVCNAMRYGFETPSEFFKSYEGDDRGSLMAWCFLTAVELHYPVFTTSNEMIVQLLDLDLDPNSQLQYSCDWISECELCRDSSYFKLFLGRVVASNEVHDCFTELFVDEEDLFVRTIERTTQKFLGMKADANARVEYELSHNMGTGLYVSIRFSSSVAFLLARVFAAWTPHDFSSVVERVLAGGAEESSTVLSFSAQPPGRAKLRTSKVEVTQSRKVVAAWQRLYWARYHGLRQAEVSSNEASSMDTSENNSVATLEASVDAMSLSDSDTEVTEEMEKTLAEAMGPKYLELCEEAQQDHWA